MQTEICNDCRKPIAGSPYLSGDRILCQDCWQKHAANPDVICANCDRKLGRLESRESYRGQTVCAACFRLLVHSPSAEPYDSASAAPRKSYDMQPSLGTHKNNKLLVVVLICIVFFLAVIAAVVVLTFWSANRVANARHLELVEKSKIAGTISDIANIKTALAIFETDTDRFPTTTEGLAALLKCPKGLDATWRGPYLENMPVDKWGHEYVYRCPGADDPSSYDLSSPGPDGKPDTPDDITKTTER